MPEYADLKHGSKLRGTVRGGEGSFSVRMTITGEIDVLSARLSENDSKILEQAISLMRDPENVTNDIKFDKAMKLLTGHFDITWTK